MSAPLVLEAQDGVVSVTVIGAEDSLPVVQARLALSGVRRLVVTDARGRARLDGARATDTVLAAAIGFHPQRVAIALPGDSAVVLRMIPAPTVLPELVTTAGRLVQRAAETTAPVSSVDRRELDVTAASSVDRAVGDLSGIQQNAVRPAGTTLQIRGLGESRVLLLVDGEPVSGALLENRDLSRTSTLAVDRIEITRGPGSLEHGSDALGGVINVVTAAPEGPLRLTGSGLVGGEGRREGSFGASAGGLLPFRLAGGVRENERVAGHESGEATLERVWDLRSTIRPGLGQDWLLRVDGNYQRTRQRWPVTAVRNGFVDTWAAGGFVETGLRRAWGSVRARVVGQTFDYRYREAIGPTPAGGSDSLDQQERVLRAVVAMDHAVAAHRLAVGVEGSLRHVEAPGKIAGSKGDDRQVEAYLQDSWSTGRWLVRGGARLTENSRWGTALAPSLGVAFEASPAVRLRASVSRGFRGPSLKELSWTFPNVAAGYLIQGNPALDPESAWSFSGGVSVAPVDGLLANADVYRNAVRGLIDFRYAGTTESGLLIYTPTNVARARTQGVELSLRLTRDRWIATLGYDYLDARDLTADQPLDRRAHHTGRLRLTRLINVLEGGALDLAGRYVSEAPILGGVEGQAGVVGTQGELFSVDAQASVDLVAGLQLALGVDNILDQHPDNTLGMLGRRAYFAVRAVVQP